MFGVLLMKIDTTRIKCSNGMLCSKGLKKLQAKASRLIFNLTLAQLIN